MNKLKPQTPPVYTDPEVYRQRLNRPDPMQRWASRMEPVLGHSKARLLLALQQPNTTSTLAADMHTTPSAVSQLLHRLLAAGLLSQQRNGRQVLYQLTPKGAALIALFRSQD